MLTVSRGLLPTPVSSGRRSIARRRNPHARSGEVSRAAGCHGWLEFYLVHKHTMYLSLAMYI